MSVCAPREREAECAPRARTCMTCTRAEVCSMSCLQTEVEGGATRCILLEVGVMLTVCHVFGRGDMQQTQRGGRVRRLRAPAGSVRGRASPAAQRARQRPWVARTVPAPRRAGRTRLGAHRYIVEKKRRHAPLLLLVTRFYVYTYTTYTHGRSPDDDVALRSSRATRQAQGDDMIRRTYRQATSL